MSCGLVLVLALSAQLEAAPDAQLLTPDPQLEVVGSDVRGRVGLALEYDSNALRLPLQEGEPLVHHGDSLMRFSLDGDGSLETGSLLWTWNAALGGKLFFDKESERTLAAQARLAALLPTWAGWRSQASGFFKARSQISGVRSYALTRTDIYASRLLGDGLVFRGGLHGSSFQSADAPFFSSTTGGAQLGLTWYWTAREVLDLSLDGRLRAFPFLTPAPPLNRPPENISRVDVPYGLRLNLRSARSLYVDLGYGLTRNDSNSRGEAFTRHELSAMIGTRLPAEITATLSGSLQLTLYDDGLSVGQRIFLNVDDESQNSLQLALTRPWIAGISLEARLAVYTNELSDELSSFSRSTATVGIRSEL